MILYACLVRLHDGLPLSASTDFHPNVQILECKRWVKRLSVTLSRHPPRGTTNISDFHIHFLSSGDIASLAVCSSTYPSGAAFRFLEELLWEFSASYNSTAITLASRPYAFLEFGLNRRMSPVSPLGILSLTLSIMCAALSLIRGVHLAEHSFQDGYENSGRVVAFLTAFLASISQCHLYLFYSRARTGKALVLVLLICLCNVYLYGLRNAWQILFHVFVAFLSAQQIVRRKPLERRGDGGV